MKLFLFSAFAAFVDVAFRKGDQYFAAITPLLPSGLLGPVEVLTSL